MKKFIMKKSIIGKKYQPFDNSWEVNITSCTDYPVENKIKYPAGTQCGDPKRECTIISEPFMCNVMSIGLSNPKITREMIMVDIEGDTHMIMFFKECIIK